MGRLKNFCGRAWRGYREAETLNGLWDWTPTQYILGFLSPAVLSVIGGLLAWMSELSPLGIGFAAFAFLFLAIIAVYFVGAAVSRFPTSQRGEVASVPTATGVKDLATKIEMRPFPDGLHWVADIQFAVSADTIDVCVEMQENLTPMGVRKWSARRKWRVKTIARCAAGETSQIEIVRPVDAGHKKAPAWLHPNSDDPVRIGRSTTRVRLSVEDATGRKSTAHFVVMPRKDNFDGVTFVSEAIFAFKDEWAD